MILELVIPVEVINDNRRYPSSRVILNSDWHINNIGGVSLAQEVESGMGVGKLLGPEVFDFIFETKLRSTNDMENLAIPFLLRHISYQSTNGHGRPRHTGCMVEGKYNPQ
jgi:hypothetical protein